MWKKDEKTSAEPPPADDPPRQTRNPGRAEPPAPTRPTAEQAAIGPSITIRGDVTGDEDLLIQGTVEGSVDLADHAVKVGSEGRVKANIKGRIVTVEGEVEGDVEAEQQIILRPSADVKGDITAPRIVLEDGARFRGMVEMGELPGDDTGDRSKAGAGRDAVRGSSGTTSSAPPGNESGESSGKAGDDSKMGTTGSKSEREKVGGQAR